jgi:uncharacterized membrane protein YozB (DUF420 family)
MLLTLAFLALLLVVTRPATFPAKASPLIAVLAPLLFTLLVVHPTAVATIIVQRTHYSEQFGRNTTFTNHDAKQFHTLTMAHWLTMHLSGSESLRIVVPGRRLLEPGGRHESCLWRGVPKFEK